jgi:guanylate kinase
MSGILYIISAPSGSGKSTLVNEMRTMVPDLDFSISYTTRPPRGSEQDGREYHFISRQEFERMIQRGDFLEYADVFGNYYGTAKRFLDEARQRGKDLLLDIDVQGASQVRQKMPESVSIFVLPPDKPTLVSRLRKRSQAENVKPEVIERRLDTATREIEKYRDYGYILVNDRLEQAVDELRAIILSERIRRRGHAEPPEAKDLFTIAERCRQANSQERIRPVLLSFGQNMPEAAR